MTEWVVRLYFDNSVHKNIINNNLLEDVYLEIINSPSVEIYTYLCKDFLGVNKETKFNFSRLRILRFLTMINPTVSTCVIREADGILSLSECQNIKLFDDSNNIIYLSPFGLKDNNTTDSYSIWLNYYKKHINSTFFNDKNNLYDILAG